MGLYLFCIGSQKHNTLTLKDYHPLPKMDEYIESLGKGQVYLTPDGNSGYWRVEENRYDTNKTAFISNMGL